MCGRRLVIKRSGTDIMGNKGISITKGECTRISVMSTAIYPFFKTNNYKIWTIKDLNLKLKRQKERENKIKFLQTVFFVFSLLSVSYFSFTFSAFTVTYRAGNFSVPDLN